MLVRHCFPVDFPKSAVFFFLEIVRVVVCLDGSAVGCDPSVA